jgi:4-hydroxy-tetrahydrodipicolinate reductase
MGASSRVESVSGHTQADVNDFGPEVARYMRIGAAPAEVVESLEQAEERPPTFGAVGLHALIAATGLTIAGSSSETRPDVGAVPMRCWCLDTIVDAGRVVGLTEVDRIETVEGVDFSFELSVHIFQPDETDLTEWTVAGDPLLRPTNPEMPTEAVTCTQLVNRIPDVINAAPGFVTVDRLPAPRYRPLPLATYL